MNQQKVRKQMTRKSFITLKGTYADLRALQSFDVWDNNKISLISSNS